jgi:hypothetical protein
MNTTADRFNVILMTPQIMGIKKTYKSIYFALLWILAILFPTLRVADHALLVLLHVYQAGVAELLFLLLLVLLLYSLCDVRVLVDPRRDGGQGLT